MSRIMEREDFTIVMCCICEYHSDQSGRVLGYTKWSSRWSYIYQRYEIDIELQKKKWKYDGKLLYPEKSSSSKTQHEKQSEFADFTKLTDIAMLIKGR